MSENVLQKVQGIVPMEGVAVQGQILHMFIWWIWGHKGSAGHQSRLWEALAEFQKGSRTRMPPSHLL